MHDAIVAGLIAYGIAATLIMAAAIWAGFDMAQALSLALKREETLENLLTRKRRREECLPQPRATNGQFTA
jgi:hypothetical protein